MGKMDQASRGENWRPSDNKFIEQVRAADAVRQDRLEQIIKKMGWSRISVVGWEAANAAWLIAQHSPYERFKVWGELMGTSKNRPNHGMMSAHQS